MATIGLVRVSSPPPDTKIVEIRNRRFKKATGYDWPADDDQRAWLELFAIAGYSPDYVHRIQNDWGVFEHYAAIGSLESELTARLRKCDKPTKTSAPSKPLTKRQLHVAKR